MRYSITSSLSCEHFSQANHWFEFTAFEEWPVPFSPLLHPSSRYCAFIGVAGVIGLRIHFQDSVVIDLATALAAAKLAIAATIAIIAEPAVLSDHYLLVQSLRRTNLLLPHFP